MLAIGQKGMAQLIEAQRAVLARLMVGRLPIARLAKLGA